MVKLTPLEIVILIAVCAFFTFLLVWLVKVANEANNEKYHRFGKNTHKYVPPKMDTAQVANSLLQDIADDVLTENNYFGKLLDWADVHVLDDAPDYIKTYYVMYDLFDNLCETGINEFFVNGRFYDGRESQTYLIECSKILGNRKLIPLCKKAIRIDKKYKISENEDWSTQAVKAMDKLDEKFIDFDNEYSIESVIHEFFARKYLENPSAINILDRPSYTKMFKTKQYDDYDIYLRWCCDAYRQYDIKTEMNSTLYGAYIAMWYNNDISKGGLQAFWKHAKKAQWNLDKVRASFEELLPQDMYNFYLKAQNAYQSGQDYKAFNEEYDYNKMSQEVLPQLAIKVGDYYRKQK